MGTGVFDPALIPPFGAMKYHLSVIKWWLTNPKKY
jgi:hypothetical protein